MSEFDGLPVLRSPVAIAAFEGWNDAADASTAAVEHLEQVWSAKTVAELDPEEFYDFQVNRPTVTQADGEDRRIEWPTTRFAVASPPGAKPDVVLIRGIEPSTRWRTFCEDVLEVCHSLEVTRIVLLGALLADVPYTRSLPISGSATDETDVERFSADPDPVRGTDRHRRRAARRVPPGRAGRGVVLGARAALRQQPALPEGHPRAAAPGRGGARPAACRSPTWPRSRPSGRSGCAPPPSRTPSWPSTSASSRSGPATDLTPLSGDEIAQQFEKYLRRRGGQQ